MNKIPMASAALAAFLAALPIRANAAQAADYAKLRLSNEFLVADFSGPSLTSILDRKTGAKVEFGDETFSLVVDKEKISGAAFSRRELAIAKDRLTFTHSAARFKIRVVYELKPGWKFLTKQIFIEPAGPGSRGAAGEDAGPRPAFQVNDIEAFSARLGRPIREKLGLSEAKFGTVLRFSKGEDPKPDFSLYILYQNPFNVWKSNGPDISASYAPDLEWKPAYGPFASDRLCLGLVSLSGTRVTAKSVPEWKYLPDYARFVSENPSIDLAETDALVECVRAFLLVEPQKSIRVHVPWCENDYQIDVSSSDGWAEYTRIIDRAAELGCTHTLFTPANAEFSSLKENADAWGWENLLFFSLGQKIRKGEWDPARDPVPASLRKMLDYGKSRNIKFMSYSYPSLPFKQDPAWTQWAGGKTGGYSGADTGLRSFQDWWIDKVAAFVKATGAGGFSFDHWWIAYDDPAATSKYAQWFGCRRILEELRRRVPDIVIDGRQQYMNFGPWTWLAGSYPHPTLTDEQPESFQAFPDLHTDRVSADRQRFAAWIYRIERFAPPEIMPGYITHQTEREDAKRVMRRDRFRPRDWDVLGWKYSLLSSIGTAPINHVVDFIPARDTDEYNALSEADKAFFRGWLDWTDRNIDVLKRLKPIIGQPMIGRVDGTAAIAGDRGFVFLFNPNYRALDAEFALDASIGLTKGQSFTIQELFPEEGRGIGHPEKGLWGPGDKVRIPMGGAQAVVLEIGPAPDTGAGPAKSKAGLVTPPAAAPLLFGARGKATLQNGELALTDIVGEAGTEKAVMVVVPGGPAVKALRIDGAQAEFDQRGNVVTARVKFAGARFRACEPLWTFDPGFSGGTVKASFRIPGRIFDQLARRKKAWPVAYTEDDLLAPWLGSDRLLLFIQFAEPDDAWPVAMKIDGRAVDVKKAYNSIYGHWPRRTFLGFYADVSGLVPEIEHTFELIVPAVWPGQFQGVFFENVETEYAGVSRK